MSETRRARRHLGTLVLTLVCAGLSGTIYVEAAPPIRAAPVVVPVSPQTLTSLGEGPVFAMPPLSSYAAVLARPLFSSTRRPPVVEAGVADQPADFTLIGIIISPKERRALLSHGTPAKLEHVIEGQSIDGWTVTAIEPRRILLARRDNEVEIISGTKPRELAQPEPPHYAIGTEPIANGGD